eukprot:gene8085-8279_t
MLTVQAQSVASQALGTAAAGQKLRAVYTHAYAGFAAGPLTEQEVMDLRRSPDVARVVPARTFQMQMITTPTFLGLAKPSGAWAQVGGSSRAGDGVVIGVLDSGLYPENPLFANTTSGPVPSKFKGSCQDGPLFPSSTCNGKIVGCQYFKTGWGVEDITDVIPYEYNSCRDAFSHGSHTAGTIAGNMGVRSPYGGFMAGTMSGVAPAARIAVYKVCWGKGGSNQCREEDIMAGVDHAVKDQVDIINYSVAGGFRSRRLLDDPLALAFRGAAAAGIFVAAAAGNEGPDAGSVANAYPFLTTVAASSHSRYVIGRLILGNQRQFRGAAGLEDDRIGFSRASTSADASAGTGAAPAAEGESPMSDQATAAAATASFAVDKMTLIVLAEDAAYFGIPPREANLCLPNSLVPNLVAGKIVKSKVVAGAGGVGIVIVNTGADGIHNDFLAVPAVHLSHTVRDELRAYASSFGAMARLPPADLRDDTAAPEIAEYSARGPAQSSDGTPVAQGYLLKPDVTAPGSNILSASSPPGAGGRLFDLMSGTSFSTPHISGVAALIKQKYSTWSPARIKSAIMTTSFQSNKAGRFSPSLLTPFSAGAGHVDPAAALNPGLVLDSGVADWNNFLCGLGEYDESSWTMNCPMCLSSIYKNTYCDPANLNVPSIALPLIVGLRTVQRKVTSVLTESASFTAVNEQATGFNVTTSPRMFTLAPGETQVVNVTVSYIAGTPFKKWLQGGAVTFISSKATKTRLPIVARAEEYDMPSSVSFATQESRLTYSFRTAVGGRMSVRAIGMQPSVVFRGTVTQDDQNFFSVKGKGVARVEVSIPPTRGGWAFARFEMLDQENAGNDLDLYIYKNNRRIAVAAQEGTSAGLIDVFDASGNYTAYIHGFRVPRNSTQYRLHVYVQIVPAVPAVTSNLQANLDLVDSATILNGSISTGTVSAGVPMPVTLQLQPRQPFRPRRRFLGLVVYNREGNRAGSSPARQVAGMTTVTLET